MINLKIHNDTPKPEEPVLIIGLVYGGPEGGSNRGVSVVLMDELGNPLLGGYLVTFRSDGTMIRHHGVGASFGFKTNMVRQINDNAWDN